MVGGSPTRTQLGRGITHRRGRGITHQAGIGRGITHQSRCWSGYHTPPRGRLVGVSPTRGIRRASIPLKMASSSRLSLAIKTTGRGITHPLAHSRPQAVRGIAHHGVEARPGQAIGGSHTKLDPARRGITHRRLSTGRPKRCPSSRGITTPLVGVSTAYWSGDHHTIGRGIDRASAGQPTGLHKQFLQGRRSN